ncbi:MAG TPA: hypothetical protein VM103_00575 [Candidatus Paceibacterota bacterium]|nr:hypothetical protein [Candidatus Paceibacterota bacterium]
MKRLLRMAKITPEKARELLQQQAENIRAVGTNRRRYSFKVKTEEGYTTALIEPALIE